MAQLKDTIDKNTAVISQLQDALAEKDNKIAMLESKLSKQNDELEQYQRRQCLRIFGVPEANEEDTDKLAIDIAAKIGVEVTLQDIDRSHRIGRKVDDRPRPVIVKFVSYRKRREVFSNKRQLKGSGITIREDLTKERFKLLQECIAKYGLSNVWTLDGVIFVKNGNSKRRVTCAQDIV